MDIEISKVDLRQTRVNNDAWRVLEPGEARLHVERFGLSANNITYAVMGEAMSYWDFFPVANENDVASWGRLPVWGFANVAESLAPDLTEGTRVFGYFALASELVVQPGRFDDSGFSDIAQHRSSLPTVYNRYAYVETDPLYTPESEAFLMLLRPLFITSYVIDDFIVDNNMFGASTVVISSASAKTAIGAAFLLKERKNAVIIGLTSPANLEFVRSLGCYDQVVTYDEVSSLEINDAVYVDVAGRRDVTHAVHRHFGDKLRYSMIVGDTHWDNEDAGEGEFVGPHPTLLFAPVQIAKRRRDWGRDTFEEHTASAWKRFIAFVATWLEIREVEGIEAVLRSYNELLDGKIDPRIGEVCHFTNV